MGRWEELDKIRTRQSGKSMGEFGENYSYRKRYQHDYHDSSGVKWVEPNITPQGKPLYPNRQTNEEAMTLLDTQGRHRSQWCYAAYDGRKDGEIPHGAGKEIRDKEKDDEL